MSESQRFFRQGSKRRKEFLLAKTMMVLVLVFLVLNTPRILLGLKEVIELETVEQCFEQGQNYKVSKYIYILDSLARFLVIVNSSVNFIIYCLVGQEFRSQLCRKLGLPQTCSGIRSARQNISDAGLKSSRLQVESTALIELNVARLQRFEQLYFYMMIDLCTAYNLLQKSFLKKYLVFYKYLLPSCIYYTPYLISNLTEFLISSQFIGLLMTELLL